MQAPKAFQVCLLFLCRALKNIPISLLVITDIIFCAFQVSQNHPNYNISNQPVKGIKKNNRCFPRYLQVRKAGVQEPHNKAQILAAQTSALWLVCAFSSDSSLTVPGCKASLPFLWPWCKPAETSFKRGSSFLEEFFSAFGGPEKCLFKVICFSHKILESFQLKL